MRILSDSFRRITGAVDNDLLRERNGIAGVAESLDIELAGARAGLLGSAVIGGKATDVLDTGYWLMQAWQDLQAAADHRLYTCDLFYHQSHAASYLRRLRKDPHLGEPPPLPDDPMVAVEIFDELAKLLPPSGKL